MARVYRLDIAGRSVHQAAFRAVVPRVFITAERVMSQGEV